MTKDKNSNKVDPATQRRVAQLIEQYKNQLEILIPQFASLLKIREELDKLLKTYSEEIEK